MMVVFVLDWMAMVERYKDVCLRADVYALFTVPSGRLESPSTLLVYFQRRPYQAAVSRSLRYAPSHPIIGRAASPVRPPHCRSSSQ